jgi:uncharacterized membrane protein
MSSSATSPGPFTRNDQVHLGAVVAAVIAVFLPWLRFPGGSADAMDVPSLFLVNSTTDRGIDLGIVVIAGTAAALAALFVRSPLMHAVLLATGVAFAAISVLFVVQLQRRLSSVTDTSLADTLGLGPLLLLASGGVLVVVARRAAERLTPR